MTTKPSTLHTRCCVVGGGPAGMMLGYLLARAGVPVVLLEKHADFLRDFRGDTVHPSTLQVLSEVGLLEKFKKLPQRRIDHLGIRVGGRLQQAMDFSGLEPFPYLTLVPQWDLLDFLAAEGKRYPTFDLRMRHEVLGLEHENGRVVGVKVRSPDGEASIYADVVVACDGRTSTVRDGGPIDDAPLVAVQKRRLMPTRVIQAVQLQIQKRVISQVLTQSEGPAEIPAILRWLLRFRAVRHVPARLFGYGLRQEHVRTPEKRQHS